MGESGTPNAINSTNVQKSKTHKISIHPNYNNNNNTTRYFWQFVDRPTAENNKKKKKKKYALMVEDDEKTTDFALIFDHMSIVRPHIVHSVQHIVSALFWFYRTNDGITIVDDQKSIKCFVFNTEKKKKFLHGTRVIVIMVKRKIIVKCHRTYHHV